MIGQPTNFTLGRAAYRRRCQNRPPTPRGRINCERSWQPFFEEINRRLARKVAPFPYALDEGPDDDHTNGDMSSLGLLRVTVDEVWDRWQEWAVFDPPARKPA